MFEIVKLRSVSLPLNSMSAEQRDYVRQRCEAAGVKVKP